ncbi:unnamed protein product [Acanthoscelides obtectus]|uniref:Uncharacterized protein n=1 Tax=Acanthoscelides obtectus TaxID=200917 RepID=A0A9P0QBP9_ACAOB|nr:unnamed protein product [Acanthoscelides obtectus]CAK1682796.1 hypothetical protein AOBTE_LOCUS33890 [Acanthoscelides obtectus]
MKDSITTPPDPRGVESFWKDILENDVQCNNEAKWIQEKSRTYKTIQEQSWTTLSIGAIKGPASFM